MKTWVIYSSYVYHSSARFLMPEIVFRHFLRVAQQWKNRVFLSPSFRYKDLDLCLHILSSLSINEFISFWIATNRIAQPPCNACLSTRANSFLFFANWFRTLPKHSLLHLVSSFPHVAIFLNTFVSSFPSTLASYTPSAISPHHLSANHISSNLKSFVLCLNSKSACSIHSSLWSEVVLSTWWTAVSGKSENHSYEATTLSNLSQTEDPFCQCLLHVKGNPLKPKSINPHSSRTSLNCCIWLLGRSLPPTFSDCLTISLKSPAQSHSRELCWWSWRRRSQDSDLLWVSGSP